jgi:hypothetical protein
LKTSTGIKPIATTLPPLIKNDTPSYMVPSDLSDTKSGAKQNKAIADKDHMYGAVSALVVPASQLRFRYSTNFQRRLYSRNPTEI